MVDGRELRIQEAKERRAENPKEAMVCDDDDVYLIRLQREVLQNLISTRSHRSHKFL
jgi:hypothetical protein